MIAQATRCGYVVTHGDIAAACVLDKGHEGEHSFRFPRLTPASTYLGGEQRLAGGDRDGSAAPMGERPAQILYSAMVDYLRAAGWEREAPSSGWWWKPGMVEESMLGGAVQRQLEQDGIDTRRLLLAEPPEDFYAD